MLPLTSQDEADILRSIENLGAQRSDFYRDVITDLSNEIIKRYREALSGSGSGNLASSLTVKPNKNGFEIEADYYFKFIDEGVNASPKKQGIKYVRPLVQNSPYSFKNLGVGSNMEKSIAQWSGVSLGSAYGIAVSIKKHGIKAQNINDKVLDEETLNLISADLSTVLGLAVEVTFDKNFN